MSSCMLLSVNKYDNSEYISHVFMPSPSVASFIDSFAPCGPWITTADEIQDPQNLKLTTKINGELRQNSSTSNMFIKIPEIISKISKVMTLEKGDIISTGTPAGVMLNKPNAVFLKDGDKVEMEIEGLGILNNTIKVVKSI